MLLRHCSNHVTRAKSSLFTRQGVSRSRSWSLCPDYMASDTDRQNWIHRTQPLKQVAETLIYTENKRKGGKRKRFSPRTLQFLTIQILPWFCVPFINVTVLVPHLRNAFNDNIHSKSNILRSWQVDRQEMRKPGRSRAKNRPIREKKKVCFERDTFMATVVHYITIPWNTIHLHKLTTTQLAKKFQRLSSNPKANHSFTRFRITMCHATHHL